MNLKEVLDKKQEILGIFANYGFSGVGIHNVEAPWMEYDDAGDLPLAFICDTGESGNVVKCRLLLEHLLGCKVDLLINDRGNTGGYKQHSVLMEDPGFKSKIENLFDMEIEEVSFTVLTPAQKRSCAIVAQQEHATGKKPFLPARGKYSNTAANNSAEYDIKTAVDFVEQSIFSVCDEAFTACPVKKKREFFLILEQRLPTWREKFARETPPSTPEGLVT